MWKVIICLTICLAAFKKAEACKVAQHMNRPKDTIFTTRQRIEALRAGLPEPELTEYQKSFLTEIAEHNDKIQERRDIIIPVSDRHIKILEYNYSPSMWPKYNPPTTAEPAAKL